MKKVLVLMSTYNGEKFIAEQIESIENQKTSFAFDILIRDDGSSDNTIKIIKNLSQKYKNIKLIRGDNIGCNASFFELFSLAKGYEYYAISDQDDIWMGYKLQRGIEKLDSEPRNVPLLYGSFSELIDENGQSLHRTTQKVRRPITLKNTLIQNVVPGHSMIFNRRLLKILRRTTDSDEVYVYDFWITNTAALYGKIILDTVPTTKYRIHAANTVGYGQTKIGWLKERLRRLKKGDGAATCRQIQYFYEQNKTAIPAEIKKEAKCLVSCSNGFCNRIKFVCTTKLYRQKRLETLLFKLAYLGGGYKYRRIASTERGQISVAIATYNGEKYIREQMLSILRNLTKNDEVVVSDDGSTDKTLEIIGSLHDKRIKVIAGPKRGIVKNFENAIAHCSGDYIFLSDQDDVWEDNKVAEVLKCFSSYGCDLVLHDCQIVKDGHIIERSFFKKRGSKVGRLHNLIKNSYIGCCMAFKKQLLEKMLPFPDDIPMHDQWIGLVSEKFGKSKLLEKPLTRYRRHNDNATELRHLPIPKMLKNRFGIILHLAGRK